MTIRHSHRVRLPDLDDVEDQGNEPAGFTPYNQAEIEDLLFGNDRPINERLTRLQGARAELVGLVGEIDRAIAELTARLGANDDTDLFGLSAPFSSDPGDHLLPVSPDEIDDLYPEDDIAWDDGDAVPPERGIE